MEKPFKHFGFIYASSVNNMGAESYMKFDKSDFFEISKPITTKREIKNSSMTAHNLQQKFMTETQEETHFRGGVPNPVYVQWLENRIIESDIKIL